ncbi:uncharacterized protein LOC128681373 [Plodia interpunctella]|uniref:uncharacterized protein LOC128681373 n=1 Tax=Plodia interpunctella TaxID=58824 RepID=UPI00236858F1|nr:uncharacterized protein LOC128681373 [Plodia interpunctella]
MSKFNTSVENFLTLSFAVVSGCNTHTGSDRMRTTQIAQYALRLTYSQPASREKMMSRSALALAAIGLGLSTFSVRQMILHQSRRI